VLEVLEDDPRLAVLLRVVAPDVELARGVARLRAARALEPWVLVRRVVDDELRDDVQPARVRLAQEGLEVLERPVVRVDVLVASR
jgi:hypothetical protein